MQQNFKICSSNRMNNLWMTSPSLDAKSHLFGRAGLKQATY